MYKVKHTFTTRDGQLDNSGEKYAIPQEMLALYGPELFDKGCATCIFVKLEGGPATEVRFYTTGGHVETHPVGSDRWAHTTMYNPGSGYNPANRVGPWTVHAEGVASDVLAGIGLPEGWHVSTFVVFEWQEGAEIPEEDGPDTGGSGPEIPVPDVPVERIWVEVTVLGVHYSGHLSKG